MKKATFKWIGISAFILCCISYLGYLFSIFIPVNVVVIKDAGKVIGVKDFCDDDFVVYEQNGVRKPVVVSGGDCYRAVKIAWCRHPNSSRNCSVDEVAISHKENYPVCKEYWWWESEAKWSRYETNLWPFPAYSPKLQVGDRVNVGYLENKWFGNKTFFDGVRVTKYKN